MSTNNEDLLDLEKLAGAAFGGLATRPATARLYTRRSPLPDTVPDLMAVDGDLRRCLDAEPHHAGGDRHHLDGGPDAGQDDLQGILAILPGQPFPRIGPWRGS